MTDDLKLHWDQVYSSKKETEVSWYEQTPAISLELLKLVHAGPDSAIVDIGGGASHLVDALLERAFTDLTVLDLSEKALLTTQARLGKTGETVQWVVADVTQWSPQRAYDIWHDRAAFHFLIRPEQQRAYADVLMRALKPGGYAIFGTFAPNGPEKCSGLPVARHDAASIAAILGPEFGLIDSRRHEHIVPWGTIQKFQFSTFRRSVPK